MLEELTNKEDMFIFGMKVNEVEQLRAKGYNPYSFYQADQELKCVCDMIRDGYFNRENPTLFHGIYNNLVNHDHYMLLADYRAYIIAQDKVSRHYAVSLQSLILQILFTDGKFANFYGFRVQPDGRRCR